MKSTSQYESELREMIKSRTGVAMEPWLTPQLRAAAMNMVMLDKVQDELTRATTLILSLPGSQGQEKMDAHPLLAHYDKMQRTLIQQFEALGLNYKTTPSKVKEDTRKDVDQNDPMALFYKNS